MHVNVEESTTWMQIYSTANSLVNDIFSYLQANLHWSACIEKTNILSQSY